MKRILLVTDFIEGKPVIASVRYEELMLCISKNYDIIVVNDEKNGNYKSKYSKKNFKFVTTRSIYTQNIDSNKRKQSLFEKLVRNRLILSLWRTYSYSKLKFLKTNRICINSLSNYIRKNKVDYIFVTVPDIYALYLAEQLKNNFSDIPLVVEVRDIINHNVGKGNPKLIFRKAEKILVNNSDGIIALSEGIYDYYSKIYPSSKITIIKNGYNENKFFDCAYKFIPSDKDRIIFAHIGSIYKGRNLKDFLNALIILSNKKNVEVEFNIVGYLDNEAFNDIDDLKNVLNDGRIKINVIGTVNHAKAIEYLKDCDVSVILTHKKGSGYAIPGKVFEYIGACKPIIAVTKDDCLIQLISGKYGECADHDANEIDNKIEKILKTEYDFSDKKVYSRENQANKIMSFLEKF